jgi:hypothetical protein
MSAERLRDISAGAAAGDHEWADIEFALVASGIRDQEHQERLDRLDQVGCFASALPCGL